MFTSPIVNLPQPPDLSVPRPKDIWFESVAPPSAVVFVPAAFVES